MSDDQAWIETSFDKPKQQQSSRGWRRGRGNRQQNPAPEKKQQAEPDKLNESNWLDDNHELKQPQNEIKATRGAILQQQMSFLQKNGQELQPDNPIETSWVKSDDRENNKSSGFRAKQSQPKEEGPKRGNRYRGDQANNQKRETNYEQNDSRPRGGYNNGNNNYQRENNYRGGGRGRGGRGGGYRGYIPRQGQQQGNRYNNRQENNFHKKRDNYNDRQGNNQDDGPRRGNRGNREPNNYNQNYPNNNSYNNRDYNNNRSYNNNRDNRDNRDYNRDSNNRDHNNRDYNNRDSNRQPINISYTSKPFSKKNQPQIQEATVVKTQKKTQVVQEEQLIPKGRRCWPESSIYILGCKLTITYRPISQFRCKLLVIPYASLKLEYYPGNIINSSEVDYKARILTKGDQISSAGSVYLQKAISIPPFVGLAFLKIDQKRIPDSLKLGVKKLLTQVQSLQGPIFDSVIFPICQQLGNTETIICSILENLQNCKRIKEVYVTTNQAECFKKAMNIFMEQVQEMLSDNQILIGA